MNDEKNIDEQYEQYAEFLRNDTEELLLAKARKERRAERERERVEKDL